MASRKITKKAKDNEGNDLTSTIKKSMAGAQYTVYYVSEEHPLTTDYKVAYFEIQKDNTGKVMQTYKVSLVGTHAATFTAGGKGESTLTGLPAGIYRVVETKTPSGFDTAQSFYVRYTNSGGVSFLKYDTSSKKLLGMSASAKYYESTDSANKKTYLKNYDFYVKGNGTTAEVISWDEYDAGDPLSIRLWKYDAETDSASALDGASLEGAQFTIKYYAGDNKKGTVDLSTASGAKATDVWVIKTKKTAKGNAVAQLKNSDDYQVSHSGNAEADTSGYYLIKQAGTIVITETKSPTGYNTFSKVETTAGTSNTSKIVLQAYTDSNGDLKIYSGSSQQSGTAVITYSTMQDGYVKIYESRDRYNLKFKKTDAYGNPMAGVAFLVTANSHYFH
jgi:hypothetical protein